MNSSRGSQSTKTVITAATRLSARLQENLSEAARDFGLANSIDTLLGPSSGAGKHLEHGALANDDSGKETRKLLSSNKDRDKEEGLRRVLAMMLKDRPVVSYFPLARVEPDLALMSVNMYQKDLNDPNPAIRAQALRVLVGMDLEAISGMVVMSLKRSSRDSNWYVRKIVAHLLVQLYQTDAAHLGSLLPILETLLNDRSPLVVGSAAAAFNDICPDRFDYIHPIYRRLCRAVIDADEWSQCALIGLLQRYARCNFPDPRQTSSNIDPDLDLSIKSTEPLLQSKNAAVVMDVVALLHNLAPISYMKRVVRPVLRLLHASDGIQHVVLADAVVLCQEYPHLFAPHWTAFLVRVSDPLPTRKLKLRCLVALASAENVSNIIGEFLTYVKDPNYGFAAYTVNAIGECAFRQSKVAGTCVDALLQLLQSSDSRIITQVTQVLRNLLSLPSQASRPSILLSLLQHLHADHIQDDTARADVYWLLGNSIEDDSWTATAPDALRIAVKGFPDEGQASKLEIVNLAAKLVVLSFRLPAPVHLSQLTLLLEYVCTLARYDLDYNVRDRARFVKGVVSAARIGAQENQQSRLEDVEGFNRGEEAASAEGSAASDSEPLLTVEQVYRILFRPDSVMAAIKDFEADSSDFHTLSLLVDRPLQRRDPLPPWTSDPSDPALRDEKDEEIVTTEPRHVLTDAASIKEQWQPASKTPAHRRPMIQEQLVPKASVAAIQRTTVARNLDDFLNSDGENGEETSTSEEEEDSESENASESEEEETDSESDMHETRGKSR